MAKTPKGELTGAELRKLIRAHNILVSIKIPKGTDREGLIKLIEGKGYKVDHKKKAIIDAKKDRPRRPKVTLEKAKEVTKPKPKTELQKQKAAEAKAEKAEKKKKEERVIRKKAVEAEKARSKPKAKPKAKPKKEDEVRPKEKVGRPRVDPKKIKVIQPKKKAESKIEDFIKDADMNPLNNLAKKITSAESSIFTKVAAGVLLGSQLGKGVGADTARKLISKKLNEDGFNFVLGYGNVDPLPEPNTADGKLVVSLLEKFRDENKLTNSKAWIKVVKLAEKQVKKDKDKPSKGFSKERILDLFKAIMKNYTEIVEQGVGQGITQREVDTSKAVEKKLAEGKMTFTQPQKEIILKAIPAYLDIMSGIASDEQIAIAKQLQKKYKEEPTKKKVKPKKKIEPKKKEFEEPDLKGIIIFALDSAEGEAKVILERMLKTYNSLTQEQKEKNKRKLSSGEKIGGYVYTYNKRDSSGKMVGRGIKGLLEAEKELNKIAKK